MSSKRYLNKKADGRFSKMYEWLEREPSLSLGAKVVYARLSRYASDKDGQGFIAYPKLSTLCEALAISDRACRTYVEELENFGLLESVRRGLGRSNFYRFPEHEIMYGVGVDPELETPPDEDESP